jgi:hypothetical protein
MTHARIIAVAILAGVCSAFAIADRSAAQQASVAESQALFQQLASVIQSPRCMNCHTDAAHPFPRQGDDRHRHMFNVQRGPLGNGAAGLHCSMCHQSTNNAASGVPGAPGWHLAPLSMAWEGLSVKDICKELSDPKRNGGRNAAQLADHFAHEALVLWAWVPGTDHAGHPRSLPPMSHEQFMAIVNRWVEGGAACPE